MLQNKSVQYLLGLAAIIVLLAMLLNLFSERQERLQRQVRIQEKQLKQALSMLEQQAGIKSELAAVGKLPSLIEYLERLSTQINLKERIQLNELQTKADQGVQNVQLKADQLTIDELTMLLHGIESAPSPIRIAQFEMARSFQNSNRLRTTLRIAALK